MTSSSDRPLTQWQIDRRAFIEHRLFWHGRIGLADLMDTIGLSRAQASKDLNSYITDHPDHLKYDKSAKTYVRGASFDAHYVDLDPGAYLSDLLAVSCGGTVPRADWITFVPGMMAAGTPARGLDAEVVQMVLQACERKSILQISYQSMSSPEPSRREIAPHALAHDGFRWHVRAFCLRDHIFKDFVLGRMTDCRLGTRAEVPEYDHDWTDEIVLQIVPHPGLSETQRRVIEMDYGMTGGVAEIPTRRCMLFYTLKRLGLDVDPMQRCPEDQHIVLLNADEVASALARRNEALR